MALLLSFNHLFKMNFKLSLFITVAIGALMVVAEPPPPGQDGEATLDVSVQVPQDFGAGTSEQRADCFKQCMHLSIVEGEKCYEDCLKKATGAQGANGQTSGTNAEVAQEGVTPGQGQQ